MSIDSRAMPTASGGHDHGFSCPPKAVGMAPKTSMEYLVGYGKGGAFGRFVGAEDIRLRRGDRVVVHSSRGTELGTVLAPSGDARALSAAQPGVLLRRATADDLASAETARRRSEELFDACRHALGALQIKIEIVDIETLLDSGRAVVQFLGPHDVNLEPLADALAQAHGVFVLFENLAEPAGVEVS